VHHVTGGLEKFKALSGGDLGRPGRVEHPEKGMSSKHEESSLAHN
jgi:hypothetical protein